MSLLDNTYQQVIICNSCIEDIYSKQYISGNKIHFSFYNLNNKSLDLNTHEFTG